MVLGYPNKKSKNLGKPYAWKIFIFIFELVGQFFFQNDSFNLQEEFSELRIRVFLENRLRSFQTFLILQIWDKPEIEDYLRTLMCWEKSKNRFELSAAKLSKNPWFFQKTKICSLFVGWCNLSSLRMSSTSWSIMIFQIHPDGKMQNKEH
jgi:hypothetical protein